MKTNNIIINNTNGGIINIYMEDKVSKAKDTLLERMFHARNKPTINGRAGWNKLLDMYYSLDYQGMIDYISTIKGSGQPTRALLIKCLKVIINNQ